MPFYNSAKPLAGRRIVVTRAVEQAGELAQALEEAGADVLRLPLLRFVRAENTGPLDAALRDLARFDWLIFTSANAVRFVTRRGIELGLPFAGGANPPLRIAAVGPGTASAAAEAGFPVEMVAAHPTGGELGAELVARIGSAMGSARILLPRGNRANAALPLLLREAGAEVTEVVAYRTETSAEFDLGVLRPFERGNVDVITLASPSAFHALVELAGRERIMSIAQHACIAVIGPATAAAVREFGLPAPIAALDATPAGLVDAVVRYYQKEGRASRLAPAHSPPVSRP